MSQEKQSEELKKYVANLTTAIVQTEQIVKDATSNNIDEDILQRLKQNLYNYQESKREIENVIRQIEK